MEHTLTSILIIGIALTAVTSGSFLYAPGLPPYPYISGYAFTYSHVHPPLVLPHTLSLSFGAAATLAASDGIPIEDNSANTTESEEIPGNQSTPEPSEPSSAPDEASPSTAPDISPAPVEEALSSPPAPTALGEAASPTSPSDELKYYHLSVPVTYTIPTPLAWPTASQYHQQDELGQYNYGYANEHSSKQEFKLLDGITRGAYNYIDAEGKLQAVSYVSDGDGFRVAATNLPQPAVPVDIPDSPEVAAAKAAHLQALSEAVANVNSANVNANANDGVETDASGGNNVVRGCNETSEDSASNKM